ncbi:hypothetical protein F4777DRAFT_516730 [Nemania sp. FL0916]|nr:hypothetical protein F4777DRAFT_516730 [Nemania sp. FL0916]
MPILLSPAPWSRLHIGLRAVIHASESCLASSVAGPTARAASIRGPLHRQPCSRYSSWGASRPSTAHIFSASRKIIPRVHVRTLFGFRATTRYIDLPQSYEDAKGLPFRAEDLTQKEANAIFPTNLPAPQANRLLQILHGRRVAGTLDDPSLTRNTREFRISDQKRGLEYLREHVPVDEVLNAGLRAEDELEILEAQEMEKMEREANEAAGSETPPPAPAAEEETSEIPTGRLPKKPGSDSPYGVSNFDKIRAEARARRQAEEARLEEERRIYEEEMAKGNIGTLQTDQAKPRELSPWVQKYMARATSDLLEPPKMTAGQRLYPSLATAAAVLIVAAAFSVWYQAPAASSRLFPEIPSAAVTCLALIGANVAVWFLWKFPPAWAYFNRYMLIVVATPRPLQVLGSTISHQYFGHMAANMVCLWFFGTRIHDEIGRANFLALYFASGVVGFASSLTWLVLTGQLYSTALGASGAVLGLVSAFFWEHRFDEFKILGFPPDPVSAPQGLGFLAVLFISHAVPLIVRVPHNIDIVSHLGGMLTGIFGIELINWYKRYKARRRAEQEKSVDAADSTAVESKGGLVTAEGGSSSEPSTPKSSTSAAKPESSPPTAR